MTDNPFLKKSDTHTQQKPSFLQQVMGQSNSGLTGCNDLMTYSSHENQPNPIINSELKKTTSVMFTDPNMSHKNCQQTQNHSDPQQRNKGADQILTANKQNPQKNHIQITCAFDNGEKIYFRLKEELIFNHKSAVIIPKISFNEQHIQKNRDKINANLKQNRELFMTGISTLKILKAVQSNNNVMLNREEVIRLNEGFDFYKKNEQRCASVRKVMSQQPHHKVMHRLRELSVQYPEQDLYMIFYYLHQTSNPKKTIHQFITADKIRVLKIYRLLSEKQRISAKKYITITQQQNILQNIVEEYQPTDDDLIANHIFHIFEQILVKNDDSHCIPEEELKGFFLPLLKKLKAKCGHLDVGHEIESLLLNVYLERGFEMQEGHMNKEFVSYFVRDGTLRDLQEYVEMYKILENNKQYKGKMREMVVKKIRQYLKTDNQKMQSLQHSPQNKLHLCQIIQYLILLNSYKKVCPQQEQPCYEQLLTKLYYLSPIKFLQAFIQCLNGKLIKITQMQQLTISLLCSYKNCKSIQLKKLNKELQSLNKLLERGTPADSLSLLLSLIMKMIEYYVGDNDGDLSLLANLILRMGTNISKGFYTVDDEGGEYELLDLFADYIALYCNRIQQLNKINETQQSDQIIQQIKTSIKTCIHGITNNLKNSLTTNQTTPIPKYSNSLATRVLQPTHQPNPLNQQLLTYIKHMQYLHQLLIPTLIPIICHSNLTQYYQSIFNSLQLITSSCTNYILSSEMWEYRQKLNELTITYGEICNLLNCCLLKDMGKNEGLFISVLENYVNIYSQIYEINIELQIIPIDQEEQQSAHNIGETVQDIISQSLQQYIKQTDHTIDVILNNCYKELIVQQICVNYREKSGKLIELQTSSNNQVSLSKYQHNLFRIIKVVNRLHSLPIIHRQFITHLEHNHHSITDIIVMLLHQIIMSCSQTIELFKYLLLVLQNQQQQSLATMKMNGQPILLTGRFIDRELSDYWSEILNKVVAVFIRMCLQERQGIQMGWVLQFMEYCQSNDCVMFNKLLRNGGKWLMDFMSRYYRGCLQPVENRVISQQKEKDLYTSAECVLKLMVCLFSGRDYEESALGAWRSVLGYYISYKFNASVTKSTRLNIDTDASDINSADDGSNCWIQCLYYLFNILQSVPTLNQYLQQQNQQILTNALFCLYELVSKDLHMRSTNDLQMKSANNFSHRTTLPQQQQFLIYKIMVMYITHGHITATDEPIVHKILLMAEWIISNLRQTLKENIKRDQLGVVLIGKLGQIAQQYLKIHNNNNPEIANKIDDLHQQLQQLNQLRNNLPCFQKVVKIYNHGQTDHYSLMYCSQSSQLQPQQLIELIRYTLTNKQPKLYYILYYQLSNTSLFHLRQPNNPESQLHHKLSSSLINIMTSQTNPSYREIIWHNTVIQRVMERCPQLLHRGHVLTMQLTNVIEQLQAVAGNRIRCAQRGLLGLESIFRVVCCLAEAQVCYTDYESVRKIGVIRGLMEGILSAMLREEQANESSDHNNGNQINENQSRTHQHQILYMMGITQQQSYQIITHQMKQYTLTANQTTETHNQLPFLDYLQKTKKLQFYTLILQYCSYDVKFLSSNHSTKHQLLQHCINLLFQYQHSIMKSLEIQQNMVVIDSACKKFREKGRISYHLQYVNKIVLERVDEIEKIREMFESAVSLVTDLGATDVNQKIGGTVSCRNKQKRVSGIVRSLRAQI